MQKIILFTILCLSIGILSACGISQEEYDSVVKERDEVIAEKEVLTGKISSLQTENTALNEKAKEYEAIIEPYKALSEAEMLEKTNKANLKAAADAKALEESEKKKAEEQAAKEKAEQAAREKEEKLGYDTGITFDQLARTPDDYEFKKVTFTGKVVQVLEGDYSTQIRLAINSDYDKVIYIEYVSDIVNSRVLEDDIITIYGVSKGLLSYKSTMGATITIPSILVDKIEQ